MPFAELAITSNFTFLTGGSHPQEYARRAIELGEGHGGPQALPRRSVRLTAPGVNLSILTLLLSLPIPYRFHIGPNPRKPLASAPIRPPSKPSAGFLKTPFTLINSAGAREPSPVHRDSPPRVSNPGLRAMVGKT